MMDPNSTRIDAYLDYLDLTYEWWLEDREAEDRAEREAQQRDEWDAGDWHYEWEGDR